jgi:hypothetical protein
METLERAFVRVATTQPAALCMSDSTVPAGRELRLRRALIASLLLSRIIRRRSAGEDLIGLLLPASVGGALANIATTIAGKVPGQDRSARGAAARAHTEMTDATGRMGWTGGMGMRYRRRVVHVGSSRRRR